MAPSRFMTTRLLNKSRTGPETTITTMAEAPESRVAGPAPARRSGDSGCRPSWFPAVWLLLTGGLALPLVIARFPPLCDYYHWVFHGHIVSRLLFGDPSTEPAFAAYRLLWGPIPNMGSAAFLGVVSHFMPPFVAGRLLLILTVIGFAYAFAFLVRSVHGRPVALEVVGGAWVFGYFLYKGYLNYLLGLALAFIVIGLLLRVDLHTEKAMRWSRTAAFSAAAVVLYLCHVMGWVVFAATSLALAMDLARRGKSRPALRLLAVHAPMSVLVPWYVLLRISNGHSSHAVGQYVKAPGGTLSATGSLLHFLGHNDYFELYTSFADKLRSLVEPFLLFLRSDPFPSPFSIFWVNMAALTCLGLLVLLTLDRKGPQPASPLLLVVAATLALMAVLMPFGDVAAMGRPDERFAFPALLLGLASLRYRRCTARAAAGAACVVGLILGLHAIEYEKTSERLEAINAVAESTIARGERVLSIAVQQSATGGACVQQCGPTIGTPVLKWFDLVRVLETGGVVANLMNTSVLERSVGQDAAHDLYGACRTGDEAEALLAGPPATTKYTAVEILGCPDEIRSLRDRLASAYQGAGEGEEVIILRPPSVVRLAGSR